MPVRPIISLPAKPHLAAILCKDVRRVRQIKHRAAAVVVVTVARKIWCRWEKTEVSMCAAEIRTLSRRMSVKSNCPCDGIDATEVIIKRLGRLSGVRIIKRYDAVRQRRHRGHLGNIKCRINEVGRSYLGVHIRSSRQNSGIILPCWVARAIKASKWIFINLTGLSRTNGHVDQIKIFIDLNSEVERLAGVAQAGRRQLIDSPLSARSRPCDRIGPGCIGATIRINSNEFQYVELIEVILGDGIQPIVLQRPRSVDR